jgi:hypothetical protein
MNPGAPRAGVFFALRLRLARLPGRARDGSLGASQIKERLVASIRPVVAACALALSQLFAHAPAAQTATDLACTRCVNNGDIANSAVTAEKIQNGSITSFDLATNAVKAANINNGSITFGKLAPGVRDSLDSALADLTRTLPEDAAVGVAEVDCPNSRVAVSASCVCDDNGGANNFGVLFACAVDGNGAVAACIDEAGSFNPIKPSPVAIVQAACLGAESSDGTPWVPTENGLAPQRAAGADPEATTAAEAAWRKAQHDSRQAKVRELDAKRLRHRSLLEAKRD